MSVVAAWQRAGVHRLIAVALARLRGSSAPAAACRPTPAPRARPADAPRPTPTPTPVDPALAAVRADRRRRTARCSWSRSTTPPRATRTRASRAPTSSTSSRSRAGLTRLRAVFSSKIPKTSARSAAPGSPTCDLLPQYGKVAFAYSGAQTKMLPVHRGGAASTTSARHRRPGYYRDASRRAARPYNLFANARSCSSAAPKATTAKDVGFTFGDAVPRAAAGARRQREDTRRRAVTFAWSTPRASAG